MVATLFCRICGYEHPEPPWGADGQCPTYECCPCCGVEAGNEDYCLASIYQFRQEWLAEGAPWFMPSYKPQPWDRQQQLENLLQEFR